MGYGYTLDLCEEMRGKVSPGRELRHEKKLKGNEEYDQSPGKKGASALVFIFSVL